MPEAEKLDFFGYQGGGTDADRGSTGLLQGVSQSVVFACVRKTLVSADDSHTSVISMPFGVVVSRMLSGFRLLLGKPVIPKGARLGRNVYVGARVGLDYVLDGALIEIDDDVTIADGVQILCHDASSNRRIGATWVAPVHIGVRAFIGANAILLPGVRIGADAIVASGAVVTKDVEPRTIVAGVPAANIGSVDQTDERRALETRSKPVFDFALYGSRPGLTEERRKQLLEAVDKEGGFYYITREVYEEYLKNYQ